MKKKILSLIFAMFLLIPCAFLLTACGDDGKYLKIKLVDSNDVGVAGLHIEDADELSGSSSHGYFTWDKDSNYCDSMIPKEKNYIVFIDLKPGYNMGSLTMYVNGEERSLRRLSSALQMIGNPNYLDFAYDDEANVMVDLWSVKADAVNEITITFKGQTELEKYDVKVSEINNISRTMIQNYQDLRFAFSINGEEKLKENATFEDFSEYFLDKGYWIEDLIYGDQLVFKVWFEGGIVPFNNAELFSTYETNDGDSWYNACTKSYFDDATGKSVYIFDIYGGKKINMFWTRENKTEQTINYNQVSLSLRFDNYTFNADEIYTFEQIKAKFDNSEYVTFNIPNFKSIDKSVIERYMSMEIGYGKVTSENRPLIELRDGTLKFSFSRYAYNYYLNNLIFEDEGQDHTLANKPRLLWAGDYLENPNEYRVECYYKNENFYEQLTADKNWTTPIVKFSHIYDGQEFNYGNFEFEDRSNIHTNFNVSEESNAHASLFDSNVLLLDTTKSDITFDMGFWFFPIPDENGSSTADITYFEKITISMGENSFDITVASEEIEDPDLGIFTYYYFVAGASTIPDLTIVTHEDNDAIDGNSVRFTISNELCDINANNEIKITYHLKNA